MEIGSRIYPLRCLAGGVHATGRMSIWPRVGLAFVLGFLAGIVTEYAIGARGGVGVTVGIAGAVAIAASLMAAVVPEVFARAREHRQFLREHAELLYSQVYSPILSTGTTIIGQELTIDEHSMDLMRRGALDWGYRDPASHSLVPVSELQNWVLGKAHIESDPTLCQDFQRVWTRLQERVTRKDALDELYIRKTSSVVEKVFGPGFPVGWAYTTPELPRWFNGPAITQWLRSGALGYEFTEQVTGFQHRIIGGGMIILTSDHPFAAPARDFAMVVRDCAIDSDLLTAWRVWNEEDARDRQELAAFLRSMKLAGERIQATHAIPGHCDVCRT